MKTSQYSRFGWMISASIVLGSLILSGTGSCESNGTQAAFQEDTIQTTAGPLKITFVGHGSLILTLNDKVFYVDPWSKLADYSKFPPADVILITHNHYDHLDPNAIAYIRQEKTRILVSQSCEKTIIDAEILKNGQTKQIAGVEIEAVPAYNIKNKRPDGTPYHAKGDGNGWILTWGQTRVYIAGDTENTPEMKALKNIDVAFLPMNLPYTMTPEMVADAAKSFMPKILYPYHYGNTDVQKLADLLKDSKDIELRIRNMQ